MYEGKVTKYDPIINFYGIEYRECDKGEFTHGEVTTHLKKSEQYLRKLKVRPLAFTATGIHNRHHISIPIKENPKSKPQLERPKSIWDERLNKMASYKDLIHHPNKDIRERWDNSGVNEFARIFQGYGDVDFMNVHECIHKSQVPANKKVTYPRYTIAIRPEKDEPFRTRITAGGDRLNYFGDVSTDSVSMETIKCHWNSVLSTPDAKNCTGNISNMYLESWLKIVKVINFC